MQRRWRACGWEKKFLQASDRTSSLPKANKEQELVTAAKGELCVPTTTSMATRLSAKKVCSTNDLSIS